MLPPLYDDQTDLFKDLRAAMRKYKYILLQSPTGSGKTRIAVEMIVGCILNNTRMVMGFPRITLMEQTSKTLTKYGIPHTFIADGYPYDPFAHIFLGMTKTMATRCRAGLMPKRIKAYIPDELHYGETDLDIVIKHFKTDGKTWIVGLSATPWKMNGQGLGIWCDYMVQGKSIRWLMDNKRLSDYQLFGGRKYEHVEGMSEKNLAEKMEAGNEIVGDCVSEYTLHSNGRLWVTRCTSVKHSEMTAEKFRDAGVPTAHVDGKTSQAERDRIFKAYGRRELKNLTFADLLNFGFDLSQASGIDDVCIEGGSDLKPSDSLAGQLQFWGRLIRYKPFHARINDHVNNHKRHGWPDDDRIWTLDSKTKKERGGEPIPPTRLCLNCSFVHRPAPACPECGYEYEIESRFVKRVAGILEEAKKPEEVKVTKGEYDPRNDGFAGILPPLDNERELEALIQFAVKKKIQNPIAWAALEFRKKVFDVS